MDPPPPPRGRSSSRYGSSGSSGQQFPFVVDPTEAAGAAAVRAFFPVPDGEPPPPSSGEDVRAPGHQRYGEISHGHGQGMHHHHHHRYHLFGVEGKQLDAGPAAAPQLRHSSSPPAGFFSRPVVDNGFPSARAGVGGGVHHGMSSYHKKMKSPMNLARQGTTLSHISEDGIPNLTNNVHGSGHPEENITTNSVAHSFSNGFSIGTWEDSNSIMFSNLTSKEGIHNNDDIIASLSNYELQFGMTSTKETSCMDRYLQMQQDQVPFRVRAKRGCATHPRSIAERERRTRISEKLRKLQALVPNMDKQTSTADMLDLAVDHIRGLRGELQALKKDKEKCTCRDKHHHSSGT